ncbi:MAG: TIGR04076 family protein [Firmicutes bacterium]|jgi:uncharacterized repeat protein (TIGR04076 family)|nr:TIGR04076 family protein [Bacillota bacterium]
MGEEKKIGYTVIGTIKEVKGSCSAGHKVGDQLELSMHKTGGMCGAFYHDIYPYVVMLQMGGSFPAEWGDVDTIYLECMDRYNVVGIELKRIKE